MFAKCFFIVFTILIANSSAVFAEDLNFKNTISSLEEFNNLARKQNGLSFSKFIFEFKTTEKNVYFQNTKKYEFHFSFLKDNLAQYENLTYSQYEKMILSDEKELIAGAIYHSPKMPFPDSAKNGVIGFNIYFGNKIDLNEIVLAKEKFVQTVTFINKQFVYIFNSKIDYFKNRSKLKALGVVSSTLSKFMELTEKPVAYNSGISYGYLKKLTLKEFEDGEYTAKNIVLLSSVPLDIAPSAGIITSEPQIPHSHVILRAINQKIPDLYVPDALTNELIIKNIGKLVQFKVEKDNTFTIKGDDEIESSKLIELAEEYFASRVPSLPEIEYDLSVKDPFVWGDAPLENKGLIFGAKGTNFANLDIALKQSNIDRSLFSGSFLIPFSYFNDHIEQRFSPSLCSLSLEKCSSKASELVCEELLNQCLIASEQNMTLKELIENLTVSDQVQEMLSSAPLRKAKISLIKNLIKNIELDEANLAIVKNLIQQRFSDNRRIRFRSSTNAEDLAGLNGAGLYKSASGCIADEGKEKNDPSKCLTSLEIKRKNDLILKLEAEDPVKNQELIKKLKKSITKKKLISAAMKKVFASLWNEKAFLSRDYYRIDHKKVFMGILVHPSFIDESSNGVIITENQENRSIKLNIVAQIDNISITNPEVSGAIPEQTISIVSKFRETIKINRVSFSNQLPEGRANVLSKEQLISLGEQVHIIRNKVKGLEKFKFLDFEFKTNIDGQVIIKQVRSLGTELINGLSADK